jgi:hypothetical protein
VHGLEPGWVSTKMGGASAPGDMKKRIQRRHGLLTWVSLAARPRHFFPTPSILFPKMTRRSRSKRCSAKVFRIDGVPEGVLMGCIASATLQLDSLREKAESLEAKEGAKFGLTSTPFRSLRTRRSRAASGVPLDRATSARARLALHCG